MNIKQYISAVLNSGESDWISTSIANGPVPSPYVALEQGFWKDFPPALTMNGHHSLFVLKEDIDISFAFGQIFQQNYKASWANSYPDPKAVGLILDFYYRGALIKREHCVTVDGGRAYLPIPEETFDREGVVISRGVSSELLKMYGLINDLCNCREYADYLRRAGINGLDQPWAH